MSGVISFLLDLLMIVGLVTATFVVIAICVSLIVYIVSELRNW